MDADAENRGPFVTEASLAVGDPTSAYTVLPDSEKEAAFVTEHRMRVRAEAEAGKRVSGDKAAAAWTSRLVLTQLLSTNFHRPPVPPQSRCVRVCLSVKRCRLW